MKYTISCWELMGSQIKHSAEALGLNTGAPLPSTGHAFQDTQWMPAITDSTEP